MLVSRQRMADEHGVGLRGVQRAVCLIGDLERRDGGPGIEHERLRGGEPHDEAVRLIRLGAMGDEGLA